jgi:hypothetical protein
MEEDLDNLDKTELHQDQQPIEKPKKERTEKQKEATQKMLIAKKQREDDLRTLRMEREMKEKEQRDKLNEKIQKKIVEKAIKISKKKPVPTKKELLALLDDNDDDDEPEPEPEPEPPILKKKTPVKQSQPKTTPATTKPPLTIKFI